MSMFAEDKAQAAYWTVEYFGSALDNIASALWEIGFWLAVLTGAFIGSIYWSGN